jgi:hypothetical protein
MAQKRFNNNRNSKSRSGGKPDNRYKDSEVSNKKVARKYKSNKGRKGRSETKDEAAESPFMGDGNDPRWYGIGNPIVEGVYNIPQLTPLGSEMKLNSNGSTATTADAFSVRIPGVMTYNWVPIFPTEMGAGALNSAFANMYSYIRHANSGKTNYSMGALACYQLAATSILAWMANLRRLYGFMHSFDGVNTYYPKVVVEAMGFDYEDLVANLPSLYAYINYATSKCSAIWLPITSTLPMRWEFLNSEIYVDSETVKPQTYFYKMDGLYKWYPEASKPGEAGLYYVKLGIPNNYGVIQPNTDPEFAETGFTYAPSDSISNFILRGTGWDGVDSRKLTDFSGVWPVPGKNPASTTFGDVRQFYGTMEHLKFQGLKYFTEWLINDFINDEDRGIIAGDILKAYGAENLYKWPTIPEFYTVAPKHDDKIAIQFRNTRTPMWDESFEGQTILDDGASLDISSANASSKEASDMAELDHVLTFDTIADPADIAYATRNIPFTDGHGVILSGGTEAVYRFQIWYKTGSFDQVVGGRAAACLKFGTYINDHTDAHSYDLLRHVLSKLITFNVKPTIFEVELLGIHNRVVHMYCDADNYFPYTLANARLINTAAVSFEYGVPLAVGVKK